MKSFYHLFSMGWKVMLLVMVCCTSCIPQKKIIYLQGSEEMSEQPLKITQDYELTIQPDDQLAISIASKNKELIEPFNTKLLVGNNSSLGVSSSSTADLSYFIVDKEGYIDFPILGRQKVKGLTRSQLAQLLQSQLISGDYIKDAEVTVKIMSFKVTVLGEVGGPGVQTFSGERLTILEAIANAGDLKPSAKRKNVMVIREENGKRKTYYVDLTSNKSVMESPVYYLQQNDLVYVEPNKSLGLAGSSSIQTINTFGGMISMILSLATVVITVVK